LELCSALVVLFNCLSVGLRAASVFLLVRSLSPGPFDRVLFVLLPNVLHDVRMARGVVSLKLGCLRMCFIDDRLRGDLKSCIVQDGCRYVLRLCVA
jgi:hypothetical protein